MVGICNSIGLITVLLRELSRLNPTQPAVGRDFFVVPPPFSNALPSLGQAQAPMLVQAFISKLAFLKLSMSPLCMGLPGWVKRCLTPCDVAHAMNARLVNSGPLSVLTPSE